jgi:NitT/TauT family transport system permease protein
MVKGLGSADPLAYDLMRSYAANPWQVYWKLRFPVALPYLFTGLKVGATASLVGAIIAELPFGSTTGLGARLLAASTYDQTIAGWSTMLAASVLGLVGFSAIVLLERLAVKQRAATAGDERP